MISNTAATATSLFQYVDDQRAGSQVIGETGETSTQNKPQENHDKQMKHVTVQSLDSLVDKVMSEESKVSAETMDDMLNFYFDQVEAAGKGFSDEYSIDNTPAMHLIEDKWQSEKGTTDRDLRQFKDSLNGDIQLSQRIDKVLKLSEIKNSAASDRVLVEFQKNPNCLALFSFLSSSRSCSGTHFLITSSFALPIVSTK